MAVLSSLMQVCQRQGADVLLLLYCQFPSWSFMLRCVADWLSGHCTILDSACLQGCKVPGPKCCQMYKHCSKHLML